MSVHLRGPAAFFSAILFGIYKIIFVNYFGFFQFSFSFVLYHGIINNRKE